MKKLLVLLLILFPVVALAQPYGVADTVQARMLTIVLPDSTLIRYEATQLRQNFTGGYRYLAFADSTGSPESSYLKTKPFEVQSNSDTVSVYRFAGFDDANLIVDNSIYTTEAQADSAGDARFTYYANKEFHSGGGYFNPSSAIRFIAKIRRASDDATLHTLDTLRCYLNADGHLRFRTPGRTASWFHKVIQGDSGTAVYLQFDVECDLPTGTTPTYFGQESIHEPELPDSVSLRSIYQELPAPAPKRTSLHLPPPAGAMNLSMTAVYPNPATDRVWIGLQSDYDGVVLLTIADVSGQVVAQSTQPLARGFNLLAFRLGGLANGPYRIIIESTQETLSHSFIKK